MATYSDIVQDSYLRPVPGASVYVFNRDGTEAGISPNPVMTDALGAFAFTAPDAVYDLEYRYGGVTLREDSVIVGDPVEYIGPPGPATNFRVSLAALKAASIADSTSTYDRSVWTWETANAPYVADDINTVKADSTALTVGAWVRQQAKNLAYRLPALAAQTQTQSEKNEQTVDVFDALTPAMRAAVKGGSFIDVGPAIDAICDFAAGKENTGTVGGLTLWLKGGRYSSSVPLRNTIRFDKQITDDGDCRRMNLCGDGSANTMFFYQGDPAMPAYSVKGYNSGNGQELYHVIEGLRIRRQAGARGQSIGVKLNDVANIHWIDAHVDGFNVGIDAEGVLGWLAENLFVLGNNGGILSRLGTGFTRPNLWHFVGGAISGNAVYGAQFSEAANISFAGTRFEANGADDSVGNKANQFVLNMIGAPAEGGAWLGLDNCYFENNNVETEVTLTTSSANSATMYARGCSFQRISNTRNPNRHLDFLANGSGRVYAHLDACAFRTIGSRTPSSSFKAWRNQSAKTIVTTTATFYENTLEGPDSGNFPWVGNSYPVLDVLVNADGSYNSDPMITTNVKEVIKTGTGKYTVNFKTMPTNAASVRYLGDVSGNTGFSTAVLRTVGGVDVEVRDASNVLVDRAFVIQGTGSFA